MPLYFFYTVQREVTLNVDLVTFWREDADGLLCSPMASVTLITGLVYQIKELFAYCYAFCSG